MVAVSSRANTFGSVFEKAAFTPIYVGAINGVYCAHNIQNVIQINLIPTICIDILHHCPFCFNHTAEMLEI